MASISVKKGQRWSLTKTNRGLSRSSCTDLVWDTNRYWPDENDFDLDVSIFLVGANDKVSGAEDFVFYNNPKVTT